MIKLTIPIVPSVNNCYRNVTVNRRILTAKGKAWQHEVQYIAKAEAKRQKWSFSKGEKLVMELWFYWPDKRKRDTHNSHKLLLDTLESILYENDCMVLARDMDFMLDRNNPRVEVVLKIKE